MKSLMVALDGSPSSLAALEEAVTWAERLQAELRGVFVEDELRFIHYPTGISAEGGVPIASPLPDEELKAMEATVRREGAEIREAFEQSTQGREIKASLEIKRGNVNALLVHEAHAADLVVIGLRSSSGTSAPREAGPTTETLIHNAHRPVLVVPENPQARPGVVVAYDGQSGVQRVMAAGTVLARAKAGEGKAQVAVITVTDDPTLRKDAVDVLSRYWQAHGIEPEFHFPEKSRKVSSLVVDYAGEKNAGLIVMGAFGRNPIRELFFGSTTLETLAKTPVPVLLMA